MFDMRRRQFITPLGSERVAARGARAVSAGDRLSQRQSPEVLESAQAVTPQHREENPMESRFLVRTLVAVVGLGVGCLANAQHTSHQPTRLGKVEFKVECDAAARQEFQRGIALYHSFVWTDAMAAFESALKADPTCGMAHWGRAMTMLDNPFIWPANLTASRLSEVSAALDAAKAAGLRSQREKDYVDAVIAFVRDRDSLDHRTRLLAFEAAMGGVAARYPDDTEAAILHALVTSANFNPADKTYANQLRATRILEPLFTARPDHPGVAHYLIHSYDYPPIAKHGVEAARKYAGIAPDAPHALHMPSHIFTRLGLWQDSIAANRASAKAASPTEFDAHHAADYMVYAHLQLAQDQAARQAMNHSLAANTVDHFAAAYAYAAMPARLALERGTWNEAADLPLQPTAQIYPWKKYPHAEAVNAFARGIGAARSGKSAVAREQQARLISLRDAAKELKLSYWVEQIDIQAEVVGGLSHCADGKMSDCIAEVRKAAAREDATEKHVVTPGPILPARELLADYLLVSGQPREALTEYEAVLAKEPNRYRAIAGAMQAAEKAGDEQKARLFATDLVKQAAGADTQRPVLDQAKRLTAGR
jgi:hypothetical protein